MRLLGVEFTDFACFKKQFVALSPGMNLVVGKNNAGKSALLRGLSLLRHLPLDSGSSGWPAGVTDYARQAFFDMDIYFSLDKEDRPPIHPFFKESMRSDPRWLEILSAGAVCVYQYRVWRGMNGIGFIGAELRVKGWPTLPIVISNSSDLIEQIFSVEERRVPDPKKMYNTEKIPSVPGTAAPDGRKLWAISSKHYLAQPLTAIRRIRTIDAHRVVQKQLPLQTARELPDNAANLAQFLQTQQSNARPQFDSVERLIRSVFPEFARVNPAHTDNTVSISLTDSETQQDLGLHNCGTGVEQLLALASFVVTQPRGTIFLMDEPHAFLHPLAERHLWEFLSDHPSQTFLIATHSAAFINAANPERICFLERPGQSFAKHQTEPPKEPAAMMDALGFKNSDLLFFDRLVVVEGETDRAVLPILLRGTGLSAIEVEQTGFPRLQGTNQGADALQKQIVRFDNAITSVGKHNQPRIYLLDGDKTDAEKATLVRTSPTNSGFRGIHFLPVKEIENYFLIPEVVFDGLREQARQDGIEATVTLEMIRQMLEEKCNSKPYDVNEVSARVKGSDILTSIFWEAAKLNYEKPRTGRILAGLLNLQNQPRLKELSDLLKEVLPKRNANAAN